VVCWQRWKNDQHLFNPTVDMEVEKKPFFPPVNCDYCEHIPSPDIMCCRKDTEISKLPSCETWLKMLEVYLIPISHWLPAAVERKVTRFDVNFSNFWPFHSSWIVGPVSHERYERECDVGLCMSVSKFTTKDANCDILSAGRFQSHKKSHHIGM
jgi:hypothetical protein